MFLDHVLSKEDTSSIWFRNIRVSVERTPERRYIDTSFFLVAVVVVFVGANTKRIYIVARVFFSAPVKYPAAIHSLP